MFKYCIFLSILLFTIIVVVAVHAEKGVIFINGFNIGRYWPLVGPQITLYVPKELLRPSNNSVILVELQRTSKDATISFSDTAIFK